MVVKHIEWDINGPLSEATRQEELSAACIIKDLQIQERLGLTEDQVWLLHYRLAAGLASAKILNFTNTEATNPLVNLNPFYAFHQLLTKQQSGINQATRTALEELTKKADKLEENMVGRMREKVYLSIAQSRNVDANALKQTLPPTDLLVSLSTSMALATIGSPQEIWRLASELSSSFISLLNQGRNIAQTREGLEQTLSRSTFRGFFITSAKQEQIH